MRLFTSLCLSLVLLALPASSASATTYYLSPTGNDANSGTNSQPWQTITKANSVVQSGDTVIFKDGTYPIKLIELTDGVRITKSGTTWKAENQHKAIIDGGLGPELFQGRGVWDAGTIYREKLPNIKKSEFWHNMVMLVDVSNVTIDGLVFANSPSRGLTLKQASPEKTIENILIKNCWFDFNWGHGFLAEPYANSDQSKMKNIVGDNNLVTRASLQMWAYQYDGDRDFFTHWPGPWRPAGNENIVTRNSLFAFGQGEIGAGFGVTNHLFENNTVIHSFIGHYMDENKNVTIRNNLIVSDSELQKNPKPGIPRGKGGIVSTRESSRQGVSEDFDNGNFLIYNNILVGVGMDFTGAFPDWWAPGNPLVYRDTKNVYVGHNTFVVTPTTKAWCSTERIAVCFPQFEYPKNKVTGIFENNLLITEQLGSNRAGLIHIPSDSRVWQMSARKNLLPPGSQSAALMYADAVVSDNSGVVNPNAEFHVDVPNMLTTNREEIKANALNNEARAKAYVNNLKLKADSPAIDKGSTAGAANGVTPPIEARTTDFYGNARVGTPDIGAIEFNGTQPSPPTDSPPTNPPSGFDFNDDGKVDILDFTLFVANKLQTIAKFDTDGNGSVDIFDFSKLVARLHPLSSTPTNTPSSPPTDTPGENPGKELVVYDWNKKVEVGHHGFPSDEGNNIKHNTDWTQPTNYAGGTIYYRVQVRSQPVPQDGMHLQLCFWQAHPDPNEKDNFYNENCGSQHNVKGTSGNIQTWSDKADSLWKKDGRSIDWNRPRFRVGVAVKNVNRDPVSDYAGWNWNGEKPGDWYPLDYRFTAVVVEKGKTFSGWQNYP